MDERFSARESVTPQVDRPSTRRTVVSVVAGVYLLFQLALPVFVMARPGPTWRDFSWDMFSHSLSCSKIDAFMRLPDGTASVVRLDGDFSSFWQLSRVLLPGRLEPYAAGVCAKLRAAHGQRVELHFVAQCRDDRDAPTRELVDSGRDYCVQEP